MKIVSKAETIYFEVIATIEGEREVLFGSFVKADCQDEIDAERDSWKDDGYKGIKIVSRETGDTPDADVYPELVTSHQLFMQQAPSFNFELDESEILELALERGFVTPADQEGYYLINSDY